MGLPDQLSRDQKFCRTGEHGAGLYDVDTGEILVVREDVGRHNAVDKVLGWAHARFVAATSSGPGNVIARQHGLVQKAAMAGVPMMVAVSAPSSLAVELARESDMTWWLYPRPSLCHLCWRSRIVPPGHCRRRRSRSVTQRYQ